MQLNVLANRDVGQVAGVFPRERADDAKLFGGDDAVGDGDAHHEVIGGESLAALAAGGAYPVTLRVDAPPLEVVGSPLGDDARAAGTSEGADLVEGFPGVLFALQAFSTLGFGCLLYTSCV